MSRIRRVLSMHTSLGPAINYTLQATVPAHMLSKCAAALPRPNWEPIIYYSAICIMGFLLFCIFVAAYFESDRIFHSDMFQRRSKVSSSTQTFDKGKVFDLKTVAGVRGPDGQASPTPVYTNNNRLVQQMTNMNGKGCAVASNGHVDTLAPHFIRRSRKETPSKTSRLFVPLRYFWNSILGWLWSDNPTAPSGSSAQRPSSASCKTHKSSSNDRPDNNHATSNGKGEVRNKPRSSNTKDTSWLKQISSLLSSYTFRSFTTTGSSATNKTDTERNNGKSQHTHENGHHGFVDADVSGDHSVNRKATTNRDISADSIPLSREANTQHTIDDDADDEEIIRKDCKLNWELSLDSIIFYFLMSGD